MLYLSAGYFGCFPLVAADPNLPVRPNIVFILADDLGYGDLSCQNPGSRIQTPRLDRLARQGMRFTDAHAPSALCTPSRYGLLTGQNCWRTRLKSGVLNSWDEPLIASERLTVARFLKDNGYRTACFGKWHLGLAWPFVGKVPAGFDDTVGPADVNWSNRIGGGPVDNGFDYYFGVNIPNEPPYVFIENDRVVETPTVAFSTVLGQQGHWGGPGVAGWDWTQVLPQITSKAVRWLKQVSASQEPFFLYAALVGPHQPVLPSKEFQGSSKAGVYGDYVQELDWAVGELLDALDATGASTNTLVIFTSDNGPDGFAYERLQQYQHASMGPLRGVKNDVWEGGHRVPFLARWSGRIVPGSTNSETICLIDFMRTVADILQAPLPPDAAEDSVSFLPQLLGQPPRPDSSRSLVLESGCGQFGIRSNNWMFIDSSSGDGHNPELEPLWFKVNRGYTTVMTAPALLYDLSTDVAERVNLLRRHPHVAAALQAQLIKERASATWRGTVSGNWATTNNWVPAGLPLGADVRYTNLPPSDNSPQVLNRSFTINSVALARSLTGSIAIGNAKDGSLTIANGIEAAKANADLTLSVPVALSQSQVWSVGSSHFLMLESTLDLGNHRLTICGDGNASFSNSLAGTGSLRFRNAGTNLLAGSNYFSGGIEISGGGVLVAANNGALGLGGLVIPNNSTLRLGGGVTLTNPAAICGVGANCGGQPFGALESLEEGTNTYAGPIALLGSIAVRSAALGSTLDIAGCISGNGDLRVLPGQGTTLVGTSQLYTGRTLVEGRLMLSDGPDRLPTNTDLVMADSVGAALSLNSNDQTIRSLEGGGPLGGNITLGTATLTVAPTGTVRYCGRISGAGNLKKLGPGNLILAGLGVYTGQTLVSGGVLVVNGDLAGEVLVQGGALSGWGAIGGQLCVGDGGSLHLAISPKPLVVSSDLVLSAGSRTSLELNPITGRSGRVEGLSSAHYDGTLCVSNVAPSYAITNGQSFRVFSATLASGNFSQIQPAPGPGLAWSFDAANGVLTALARPELHLVKAGSKAAATVSWSGNGFHLQVMTNSSGMSPDGRWFDYPATFGNPTTLPIDLAQPGVFFRVVSP